MFCHGTICVPALRRCQNRVQRCARGGRAAAADVIYPSPGQGFASIAVKAMHLIAVRMFFEEKA